ncbi:MAG: hypothetical protein QOI11_454 [Candidatus Eremiobacteraeota bacterium]|nr:hypothetical protein [Candidatus Eremiobacteraeota bacterium]
MSDGPYYAIFLMGGAANGKTTALQTRFRLSPYDPERDRKWEEDDARPLVPRDRRLDPDNFKLGIPMFTFAPDDPDSRERFGVRGLGGPSGPANRDEYERYPFAIRSSVEAIVRSASYGTLREFVNEWLFEQNPNGEAFNFGGGLTHELSKALAQRYLRRFLAERPPSESFVWDGIGNEHTYLKWIDGALEAGYWVRVLYVRAPLPVAQMWASGRNRRLPPSTIRKTYFKAANAAWWVEEHVRSLGDPKRASFELIRLGDELLDEAEKLGFTNDGQLTP